MQTIVTGYRMIAIYETYTGAFEGFALIIATAVLFAGAIQMASLASAKKGRTRPKKSY